jgi:lipopolysaccharide export system ATP-binding protein
MLEAIDLEKQYKNRTAVRKVSLQVHPAEIVGFLGPNGAGKTTCFQMIAGLILPSKGEVYFNGKPVTTLPLYRRARMGLSYLPQEPSIFRKMSVEDNIRAILEMQPHPPSRTEQQEKVFALLGELNLTHLAKQSAATLSGGERRRLEITRALVHNPKILLLDEPFSGIDPIVVIEIQQILFQLKEKGIGIFITDHNIHETLRICDRGYIIHQGEILFSGTPLEIAENKSAREFYLGQRFVLNSVID